MSTVRYSEFEYWSPVHDADVVRVSVVDDRGQEYFHIVHADGKGYAKRREAAVDLCLEAIRIGCAPGEVRKGR